MELKKLMMLVIFFFVLITPYYIFSNFYENGIQLDYNWFCVYMVLFYICYAVFIIIALVRIAFNINKNAIIISFFKYDDIFFPKFILYNLFFNFLFFIFFWINKSWFTDSVFINFFFFLIKSIARLDYTSIFVTGNRELLFISTGKYCYINILYIVYFLSILLFFLSFLVFFWFFKDKKKTSKFIEIDLLLYFYGIFLTYFIVCTTIYYNFSIFIYLYLLDFFLYCIFKKRSKLVNILRFHFNVILISTLKYIWGWGFFLSYLFIFFYFIFFIFYVLDILTFDCFL